MNDQLHKAATRALDLFIGFRNANANACANYILRDADAAIKELRDALASPDAGGAAVAGQGERPYPPLPESIKYGVVTTDSKHSDLFSVAQMRAYVDADRSALQGAPTPPALTPDEIDAIIRALAPDHNSQAFEPECPACTAYKKLTSN